MCNNLNCVFQKMREESQTPYSIKGQPKCRHFSLPATLFHLKLSKYSFMSLGNGDSCYLHFGFPGVAQQDVLLWTSSHLFQVIFEFYGRESLSDSVNRCSITWMLCCCCLFSVSLCQRREATAEKIPLGLRMRSETPFQQTRCLFLL